MRISFGKRWREAKDNGRLFNTYLTQLQEGQKTASLEKQRLKVRYSLEEDPNDLNNHWIINLGNHIKTKYEDM